MLALIFDIKRYAIHDGPGIRTTIFFKGCPMKCWWCHNPEGISAEPETIIRERMLDGRIYNEKSIAGKWMDTEEVMHEILKDKIFYEESGGGVTFSGGEPLCQPDFLKEIILRCKEMGIHTALDTSGYAPQDIFTEFLDKVNLFLFDLKLIDDEEHIKYTGVSNRAALDNLRILINANADVHLRFPVIPGITDTDKNLKDMELLLKSLNFKGRIDFLPYHSTARNKYKRLGLHYRLEKIPDPDNEHIEGIRGRFITVTALL